MDFLEGLVGTAVTVAVGSVLKNKVGRLPNDAIPFVNFALGAGAGTLLSGGDLETGVKLGVVWSTSGTGIHQAGKLVQRHRGTIGRAIVGTVRKVVSKR